MCQVGQTNLVIGVRSRFISKVPCKQDYKSLCAAVTIRDTLVNIQTGTQTDSILTTL